MSTSSSSLLALALAPAAAFAASLYAPIDASCPGSTLVRSASGISASEATYIASRKPNADAALTSWLASALPDLSPSSFPTIALSVSGGGFRSLLTGAGVIQAFDERDSTSGTAGLYQAFSYHAALSGGAWLLSALAAGDWPTVSELRSTVWDTQFAAGILDSSNATTVAQFTQIAEDILTKGTLGFPVSLTDPWGRMLSYQVMGGGQGAAAMTLTDIVELSNFTGHAVPFPIMTASKIDHNSGECEPSSSEAIFEFNPYEFGSWSGDVAAFVEMKYLGSNITAGIAIECATGYDKIDWAMGVSSNLLEEFVCNSSLGFDVTQYFPAQIIAIVEEFTPATEYGYSFVANPFKGFLSTALTALPSTLVQDTLHLVDGGEPDRNVPLLPLLEPSRAIDVIIVSDNSNDELQYPDGTALVAAYEAAQTGPARLRGRFPAVPAVGDFSTAKAQFFGCNETEAVTVVYLPNSDWTYASNISTLQLQFSAAETDGLISNGIAIATQGGDEAWAGCLACGLMLKEVGAESLPGSCDACLEEYCWYA
ncbi:unnamed protein product [Discula destructiva]